MTTTNTTTRYKVFAIYADGSRETATFRDRIAAHSFIRRLAARTAPELKTATIYDRETEMTERVVTTTTTAGLSR
jgi:hypothetical protein